LSCSAADEIAAKAAKGAVRDVFYKLGVNVEDAKQVEEFREDLRLAGKLRKVADKGFVALVSAGIAVLAGATWFALAAHFPGGKT
jgi:hypothetical protein